MATKKEDPEKNDTAKKEADADAKKEADERLARAREIAKKAEARAVGAEKVKKENRAEADKETAAAREGARVARDREEEARYKKLFDPEEVELPEGVKAAVVDGTTVLASDLVFKKEEDEKDEPVKGAAVARGVTVYENEKDRTPPVRR